MKYQLFFVFATIFFVASCSGDREELVHAHAFPASSKEVDCAELIKQAREDAVVLYKREQDSLASVRKAQLIMSGLDTIDLSPLHIDVEELDLVALDGYNPLIMSYAGYGIVSKNFALAAGFTSSDLESLRLKMSNPDELWEMYLQYKSIFRYIAYLYEWESNVDVTSQNLLLILEERYAQTTRDQFRSSYDAWLGGKLNIDPHARANDEWISESGNLLPSVGTCGLQQSFAAYTWCQRRYQEGEKMHGKGKELLATWAKIIRDYHGLTT